MSSLALISLVFGLLAIAFYGAALAAPVAVLTALSRFPRSRVSGWALTGVDMVWSGVLLYQMELGRFDAFKPYLLIVIPIVIFLIVRHMPELLAPRALGGLFILIPAPVLAVTRWHPSPFRYLLLVFAYALAIKGVVLVLSPYQFRASVDFWLRRSRGFRMMSAAGLGLGLLLTVLAFTAFRAV